MKLQSIYKTLATTALLGQLVVAPLPSFADSTGEPVQETTQNEKQSSASGLLGYYFTNQNFTDLAIMQQEKSSELKLDKSSLKHFKSEQQKIQSVRYVGSIKPSESGNYQFTTSDDERVAIQVDGKNVVYPVGTSGTISLEKDKIYSIRIEYVPKERAESTKDIDLHLFWTTPNGKKDLIPKENLLFPDVKDAPTTDEKRLIPTTPILKTGQRSTAAPVEMDSDNDGLPDSWEKDGYTVLDEDGTDSTGTGLRGGQSFKWDKLSPDTQKVSTKYVSNPRNAHTAGDPYNDLEKAQGLMDDGTKAEARNPLVAAYPSVGINMEKLIVSENKDVTTDKGGSISRNTSSSRASSHTEELGESATVEVSASLTDFGVKASATLSHSESTTNSTTASVENGSGENWSKQVHLNTGASAYLNPNIRYFNAGTAPIHDVTPTVGLALGTDTLDTIKAQDNNIAENLQPGETYPAKGHNAMAFKTRDQFSSHPIEATLTQLERLEKGEPLTLEVNQVGGTYNTRKKTGELVSSKENRWESIIKSRIQPATALLAVDTGEEFLERRVAAKGGTSGGPQDNAHNPELTLKEAIKIAFHATEDSDGDLSYKDQDGKTIPLSEKAVQMVTDEKTRKDMDNQLKDMNENEKHLYNVKLKQGMKILLKAPYYYDKFSETSKEFWNKFSSVEGPTPSIINNHTLLLDGPQNGIQFGSLKPNTEYSVEFEAKIKDKKLATSFVRLQFSEHGYRIGADTSTPEKNNPVLNDTSFQRVKYRFWTTNKPSSPILLLNADQTVIRDLKIVEAGPSHQKQ